MEMNNNFTAEEIKILQEHTNSTFDKTLEALSNVRSACFSMSSQLHQEIAIYMKNGHQCEKQ